MGLSSFNPLRSRDSKRPPKLPLYKEVPSSSHPSPTKERYSDVEYSSDDEDEDSDGDSSGYESSPPQSSGSSRRTSGSSTFMLPKKRVAQANSSPTRRLLPRRHLYRLPNKVIRYLCAIMMLAIIAFIVTLVRASQLENKRIAEGKVEKKPTPPPWESFEFLTRYYGGIRTLVPFDENVPQYPRLEDEGPYMYFNVTQSQQKKAGDGKTETASSPATKKVPFSKAFYHHPESALPGTSGGIHECFLDAHNKVRIPPIRHYDGRPMGFPNSVMGSYELLSLPEDICFDRFGRYGPYGYGYSAQTGGLSVGEHGDTEGSEDVWKSVKRVDWRKINWADAQRRCYKANADKYKPLESPSVPPQGFYIGESIEKAVTKIQARDQASAQHAKPAKPPAQSKGQEETQSEQQEPPKSAGDMSRTAIVVRCWDEFLWREEDVLNLRAIIAELSLASGGRYDVHLLVQVRNDAKNPIWADDETYLNHIKDTVPAEFQDMVTLWSETQMLAVYQGVLDLWTKGPNLPVHGSYRGLQMAMQHFASKHPEYDYFWQWEMDIRYTGHYYDLLSKMETWAKEQPRKGIWERNARFYVPHVHGTWEDFKQMCRVQTEQGTLSPENIWDKVPLINKKSSPSQPSSKKGEESIWGPKRPTSESDWLSPESDPTPPTTYERDKYVWGVGEEADLITLNPIFNPDGTTWQLSEDITGYNESSGIGKPPRRAQIITASRMSRRLLLTMHRETAFKKHHAFPEMWPATVALHHGYKAVYAPHPVYVDREWPTEYMARVMNGGKNGAAGGSRNAVFGDREHNLKGMTWFYNAGFSSNLYKRWLGLKVNNDGGELFEMVADNSKDKDDLTVSTMRGGEGRMCLPPMLLHPVKEVELPVEEIKAGEEGNLKEAGKEGEKEAEVISDPNA